jgi:hypothetical protein
MNCAAAWPKARERFTHGLLNARAGTRMSPDPDTSLLGASRPKHARPDHRDHPCPDASAYARCVLAKTRKLSVGLPAYLPGDTGNPSDEGHPETALAD